MRARLAAVALACLLAASCAAPERAAVLAPLGHAAERVAVRVGLDLADALVRWLGLTVGDGIMVSFLP